MSLDVYLTLESAESKTGSGIFVRENGQTREISKQEWDEKFPGIEPVIATYDDEDNEVYSANITHNLSKMADAAGIYYHLWRPDEIGITHAYQLVEPLEIGLEKLRNNPDHYQQFNSPNGWGKYEYFVPFVGKYIQACREYPNATVNVSR